jgi:hypothetical protein
LASLGRDDPGYGRVVVGGRLYDALDIEIIPNVGKMNFGSKFKTGFLTKY